MSKGKYVDVILHMRFDDGEWVVHDPRTGSDDVVRYSDGAPVGRNQFIAARTRAFAMFPGADIRG